MRWLVATDDVLDGAGMVSRVWQVVSVRLGYSGGGAAAMYLSHS